MVNVPGAIYRSAWHADYTLELISDEIERISGYPPANFIASAKRTLLSIIHPDDREQVLRGGRATPATTTRPFVLEYRIVRADGEVRWVLDRGQLVPGPGGRLWMDGAIFDITERRAAEEALRRREIEAARTEELRASRARIIEAADAARRKIERDLHDGAQQRLVALALDVRVARARAGEGPGLGRPVPRPPRRGAPEASAELRELARGIHPAVLTERGLAPAIEALAVARAGAGRDRRGAGRAAAAGGRGDRLLHGLRGADQRGQVRAGDATPPCGSRNGDGGSWSRSATTASAARRPATGSGLGGPRRPRRRLRRLAQRRQPARRGHAGARRAAASGE